MVMNPHIKLPTDDEPAVLIHGDCLDVLRDIPAGCVDAVITDPPYGMNWNTDSTRFGGGKKKNSHRRGDGRLDWGKIAEDDVPFDPSPWLGFPKVVMFGANHFAKHLPTGTTLIWIKKYDDQFGTFLSDAEIAWMKGNHGIYCHRHFWSGFRASEIKEYYHPTQKPVEVMKWVMNIAKIPKGAIVLDPYMGSGSTGVACIHTGRRFIGIEKEAKYIDIARQRIDEARGVGGLFPPDVGADAGLYDNDT